VQQVKIKWDNSIKETEKATKEILEEIANELCKVPLQSTCVLQICLQVTAA
jgi:hypothetical protein